MVRIPKKWHALGSLFMDAIHHDEPKKIGIGTELELITAENHKTLSMNNLSEISFEQIKDNYFWGRPPC